MNIFIHNPIRNIDQS